MNFWIQVFQISFASIISSAVIVGILSLLSKSLLQHWFQKDLEEFKIGLTNRLQQDIFRFSKMHERRADVIEKTYQKIFRTEKCFSSLMNPLQMTGEETKEVKAQKALEVANDLVNYCGEHRIYFSKETQTKIDTLLDKFREIWNEWRYKEDLNKGDLDYIKAWGESWRKISSELPSLKLDLENEFKAIIGIID